MFQPSSPTRRIILTGAAQEWTNPSTEVAWDLKTRGLRRRRSRTRGGVSVVFSPLNLVVKRHTSLKENNSGFAQQGKVSRMSVSIPRSPVKYRSSTGCVYKALIVREKNRARVPLRPWDISSDPISCTTRNMIRGHHGAAGLLYLCVMFLHNNRFRIFNTTHLPGTVRATLDVHTVCPATTSPRDTGKFIE